MKIDCKSNDEILKLSRIEDKNLIANTSELGDFLSVFDDCLKLNAVFCNLIQRPAVDLGEAAFIVIHNCIQLIAQDLIKGVGNLCKGYLTDTAFHTRRAIEAAATVIEVIENPSKAVIWGTMEEDEQIEEYVKGFMVFKLVKEHLSTDLVNRYKTLCLSVHPSALSVAHRTGFTEEGNPTIRFFDVESSADLPKLKMDLLNLFTAHRMILNDMANALSSCDSFDTKTFKTISNDVHIKWCDKARLHFPQLEPTGSSIEGLVK